MLIKSAKIHNDLVLELMNNLFEVTDGPNSSAMVIIESIAVRIILLCAKENGINPKQLLQAFVEGVRQRVMSENVNRLNS